MARNSMRLFIPVLIILSLALQATAAYVNISSAYAIPGSNFSVNIIIAPGDSEVYGVQYDLYFDNSKLSAVSQDASTFLSYDGAATWVITNSINNTLGKIQYAETRLGAQRGVNATGTLTVITFFLNNTVIPGETTTLNLSNVILAGSNDTKIPLTVNNGTVTAVSSLPTPTPTPLPTATASPTPTATVLPTPTATSTPSTTASPTPTATISPTPAATPTPSSTASPTPTATVSPTPAATPTPSSTASPTPTATASPTPTATPAPSSTASPTPISNPAGAIKGDTSGDGILNIVDALFVAQYTVSIRTFSASQRLAADVNNDGQISIVDALFIAQYTVGLRQL